MKEEKHFVKTNDPETAAILREAGFPELAKEGSKWVFVNQPKKDFSLDTSGNDSSVTYSNVLCF